MAVQSNLRKRPGGDEGREGIPPRARVARRQGDPQDVIMAVLSELGAQLEAFVNELRLRDMKSWGEFFAHFKAPRAWSTKVLDERLTTNFVHFRGNYSVVAAGLLVVGIVSHPSVLVALISCALLWTFLFPAGEYPRVVKVGGRVLGQSERVAASVIGIACILGLSGAWYVLLFYGGLATLLCTVHAVFRPRTIASKASRVAANAQVAAGGFTIERAQNFVENVFGMNQDSSRSQ